MLATASRIIKHEVHLAFCGACSLRVFPRLGDLTQKQTHTFIVSLVLRWGGLKLTQKVLSQPNSKTHFILPIFFQKLPWPPAVKGGKTGTRER